MPKKIKEIPRKSSNLNSEHTFSNFITGATNEADYKIGLKIVEDQEGLYNPVFIYGKRGVGKTHFMKAIGNEIKKKQKKTVLYETSNKFIENYKQNKEKYENTDVLLLDELDSIKEENKKIITDLFTILYNKNKKIIFGSRNHPANLKIREYIWEKPIWRVWIEIFPLDKDGRCTLIKKEIKNTILENKIEEESIKFIANLYRYNMNQLKSAITKLIIYTKENNLKKLEPKTIQQVLNKIENKQLEKRKKMGKLNIVTGNIVSKKLLKDHDLIINPTNPRMVYGGGVCGAIFDKAGLEELESYTQKKYNIRYDANDNLMEVGDTRITPGFHLEMDIMFVQSPSFYDYTPIIAKEKLLQTYKNMIEEASKNNYKNILCPSLGTGIYGFSHEFVGKDVIHLLENLVKEKEINIDFVIYDEKDKKYYEERESTWKKER